MDSLPLLCLLITSVQAVCPNGWTRYDASCYLFEDIKETWHSSRTYCKNLSADLAVPDSERENNFIKAFLQKTHRKCNNSDEYFWFGANDLTIENDWIGVSDGLSLTYTDWFPGEPNGKRGSNCAGFYGTVRFLWDDTNCDIKHQFVCEIQDEGTPEIIGK